MNPGGEEMRVAGRASVACIVVGPIETNCYVLSCPRSRKAIIVDPGGDPDAIEDFIERSKLLPVEIISTHGHSDHIASVADLKQRYDVPYAIHGADLEIIKLSVREAPFWGMGKIREPRVDRIISARDEITFGSVRGTVLHTPGHTPGGISMLFDGFVIVGDTLFNMSIGRTDLYGGDTDVLLRAIRTELLTLPENTIVYCGHGPQTTIGEEKRENPFLRG